MPPLKYARLLLLVPFPYIAEILPVPRVQDDGGGHCLNLSSTPSRLLLSLLFASGSTVINQRGQLTNQGIELVVANVECSIIGALGQRLRSRGQSRWWRRRRRKGRRWRRKVF